MKRMTHNCDEGVEAPAVEDSQSKDVESKRSPRVKAKRSMKNSLLS